MKMSKNTTTITKADIKEVKAKLLAQLSKLKQALVDIDNDEAQAEQLCAQLERQLKKKQA